METTAILNGKRVTVPVALIKALVSYGDVDGNEVVFDDLRLQLNGKYAWKEPPPPSKSSPLRVVNWPSQLASKKLCASVFLDDGALVINNAAGIIKIYRGYTEVNYPDFSGFKDDTAALVAGLKQVSGDKIDSLFTSQYYRGSPDLPDYVSGAKQIRPATTLLLAHASMATLCTLSDVAKLHQLSCSSGELLSPKVTEYVDRIYFSNLTGSKIKSEGEVVAAVGEKKVLVPNSNFLCALFKVDVPPEGCLIVTSTRITGFKEGSSPESFHAKDVLEFCGKLVGREVVGWVGGMASSPKFYIAISSKRSQDDCIPQAVFSFIINLYAAAVEVLIGALDMEPCPSRVLRLGEDFDNWIEPQLAPAEVEFSL